MQFLSWSGSSVRHREASLMFPVVWMLASTECLNKIDLPARHVPSSLQIQLSLVLDCWPFHWTVLLSTQVVPLSGLSSEFRQLQSHCVWTCSSAYAEPSLYCSLLSGSCSLSTVYFPGACSSDTGSLVRPFFIPGAGLQPVSPSACLVTHSLSVGILYSGFFLSWLFVLLSDKSISMKGGKCAKLT